MRLLKSEILNLAARIENSPAVEFEIDKEDGRLQVFGVEMTETYIKIGMSGRKPANGVAAVGDKPKRRRRKTSAATGTRRRRRTAA